MSFVRIQIIEEVAFGYISIRKKNYEHSSFYIETFIFNKALTATKLQFRNNNLLKNSTEFRKTIFIANNFLSFSSLKYELLDKFS